MLCAHHILEWRQNEALNSVASVHQIISDHHAHLVSKIPHFVDLYVSCGDVKEKLKIYKKFLLMSKLTILEVKSIIAIREYGWIYVESNLVLYSNDIWLIILNCLLFYLDSRMNTLILSCLKPFIFIVIKHNEWSFQVYLWRLNVYICDWHGVFLPQSHNKVHIFLSIRFIIISFGYGTEIRYLQCALIKYDSFDRALV